MVYRAYELLLLIFPSPKSIILMSPPEYITFSGFKSLWEILFLFQYKTAWRICLNNSLALPSEKYSCLTIESYNSPPVHISCTRYTYLFLLIHPCKTCPPWSFAPLALQNSALPRATVEVHFSFFYLVGCLLTTSISLGPETSVLPDFSTYCFPFYFSPR